MQAATQTHVQLTSTCFDFDANPNGFLRNLDLASPPLSPSTCSVTHSALRSVCLSLHSPQKRLNDWRLVFPKGSIKNLTPDHIIGASVQIAQGHTSPIAGFDPLSRRVRTHSGSVYELGVPQMAFERMAPEIMRSLGF